MSKVSKSTTATTVAKSMSSKMAYYDDIMSTDDIICSASTATTVASAKPLADCNYFASKRIGSQHQVIGIAEMDTMVFIAPTVRSNGIRSWEKARSDTYMRRQREMEHRNQQYLVQQHRNEKNVEEAKQKKEEKKRQEEADKQYFEQTRRALEGPVRVAVSVEAAVEEDPTW